MGNLYPLLGVPASGFSSKPFVTSWLLPQYALAVLRLIISLYIITSISYSYAYFARHKVTFHLQDVSLEPVTFQVGAEGIRQSFSYFTYLTYWSQSFYFFFAALHTFHSASKGVAFLDSWPMLFQAMHSVYYSCVTSFPFLVSAVYWASMYAGPWFDHDFDRWSALSIHGLNSAFALFEVTMTKTRPQPWAHLGILLLIMTLYLPVAYITRYTEGIYIYLWLNPDNGIPQLIAHVVGYAMAIVCIFNAVRGAIWFRCSLFSEQNHGASHDSQQAVFEVGSSSDVSRSSSQISTLRAFNRHGIYAQELVDIEKVADSSSMNSPLAKHPMRPGSVSPSYNDCKFQTSTSTTERFHEASVDLPLPARPDAAHLPKIAFPRGSSSHQVRNYSRPSSPGTTTPSLRDFWM